MGSRDSGHTGIENSDWNTKSLVGFVYLFSEKMMTTLQSRALVAYPVHPILLNMSARRRKWLFDNGYTLVGFLPYVVFKNNQKKRKVKGMKNVDVGIYILNEGAVGKRRIAYCKFRGDRTADESTSHSYESRSGASG